MRKVTCRRVHGEFIAKWKASVQSCVSTGFRDPESCTMSLGYACLYLSGKFWGIPGRRRAHVAANKKCEAWSSALKLNSSRRRPKFSAKAIYCEACWRQTCCHALREASRAYFMAGCFFRWLPPSPPPLTLWLGSEEARGDSFCSF